MEKRTLTTANSTKLDDALQSLNDYKSELVLEDVVIIALLEVTKGINNNFTTDQLVTLFEFIICDLLELKCYSLFSFQDSWECIASKGVGDTYKQIDVQEELLYIAEITHTGKSLKSHLNHYEMVFPIYHKDKPLAFLMIGGIDEQHYDIENIRVSFIHTLTSVITVAIENKRLAQEQLKQAQVRKELELAAEMQAMLFPEELPKNEYFEVSAIYKPHQEVGGDYYDFIEVSETEVAFCMADVSGKGVSAALLMSNFQANVRALISSEKRLIDLIHQLNTKVISNAKGEKFVTMFLGIYNRETKQLYYINAGHNPPLYFSSKENSNSLLDEGCPGLGMLDDIPIVKFGTVAVQPNDMMICYTDGVVETENEAKVEFGTPGIIRSVNTNLSADIESINTKIIDDLDTFKGKEPFVDDIAIISCRFL